MTGTLARIACSFGAVALLGLAIAGPALAAKKKDPGRKLYLRNTCVACHGKDGAKAIMDYPNLAGQDKKYLINQMNDIIKGKRTGSPDATGNPRSQGMRGALVTPEGESRLNKDQIKQIATWLSKLPPAKPQPPKEPIDAQRIEDGAKLYKKRCRSCHGKEGKKPIKGYPYVAGQKRAYLVTQMKDIRDKARTNGKTKAMYAIIKKLKDEDFELLADYLSQIDRSAK